MKDYYAILHVLPSAEIDVIKAAYRALSRKYHPDTCEEKYITTAKQKMQEINEAFGVIGDPDKRKKYDAERNKTNPQDEYAENKEDFDAKTEEEVDAKTEADWLIACKYCPTAEKQFQELQKLSRSLAFSYKTYLLDSKMFNNCDVIKKQMEQSFLKTYFGENEEICAFAKSLALHGNKKAALEVNHAVRVLGNSLDLKSLKKKILLTIRLTPKQRYYLAAKQGTLPEDQCTKLLKLLGYRYEYNGIQADTYCIQGKDNVYHSSPAVDLDKWIVKHFQNYPEFQIL